MASSIDMSKLSWHDKATMIHHMLHGPTIAVKDLFKFALGGSVLEPKLKHMSEAAWQLWRRRWPKDVFDDGVKFCHHEDSIIEHTVPIEVMYKWLIDNKDKLSLIDIEHALQRCPVAIILKSENALLNSAKLTKSMPSKNFNLLNEDPFSRYNAIKLKMHQFTKGSLEQEKLQTQ